MKALRIAALGLVATMSSSVFASTVFSGTVSATCDVAGISAGVIEREAGENNLVSTGSGGTPLTVLATTTADNYLLKLSNITITGGAEASGFSYTPSYAELSVGGTQLTSTGVLLASAGDHPIEFHIAAEPSSDTIVAGTYTVTADVTCIAQ